MRPCDVLVIAGDITPATNHHVDFQARWLDTEFRQWLAAVPATAIVGIAGNHDFVFERAPEKVPANLPWVYLQDERAVVDGVTFWGSPWTPWFHDWAFNAPRHDPDESFLNERYVEVPVDTDVLLIHGPPAGYGDLTDFGSGAGSSAFTHLIDRVSPKLGIFGHIHEGRGTWTRGGTTLANVSAVNFHYEIVGEPVVAFDI